MGMSWACLNMIFRGTALYKGWVVGIVIGWLHFERLLRLYSRASLARRGCYVTCCDCRVLCPDDLGLRSWRHICCAKEPERQTMGSFIRF